MKTTKRGNLAAEPAAPKPVTYPIPELAKSALALLQERFQKDANAIGRQAVQALGLKPDEYDYTCDFSTGLITRGPRAVKSAETGEG